MAQVAFQLKGVPNTYTPGASYTLNISATAGITIKGFIIWADLVQVHPGGGTRYGSFAVGPGRSDQAFKQCAGDSVDGSTWGHSYPSSPAVAEDAKVFIWTAPATSVGTLYFHGVGVQDYNHWKILSDVPINGKFFNE